MRRPVISYLSVGKLKYLILQNKTVREEATKYRPTQLDIPEDLKRLQNRYDNLESRKEPRLNFEITNSDEPVGQVWNTELFISILFK